MALELYYKPSFIKSLRRLGSEQREIVGLLLEALKIYYAKGCNLIEAQRIAPRFFYKQLRKPYYEAGIERTIRIVIRKENSQCIAMIAGNHNQIRQFLDNV